MSAEAGSQVTESPLERFKRSPVYLGGGLLIAGFLAGMGVLKFLDFQKTSSDASMGNPLTFPVSMECSGEDLRCDVPLEIRLPPDVERIHFKIGRDVCSPVRVHTYFDGVPAGPTPYLGWYSAPTPYDQYPLAVDLPLIPNRAEAVREIAIYVESLSAGCLVTGGLARWSGTLEFWLRM